MLKRILIFSLIPLICGFVLMNCEKGKEGKVVTKVNNRVLTEEDIEKEIPPESEGKVTLDQKREYVRRWIRNELLYQEAKKRGIDRQEDIKWKIEQITKDFVVTNFLEKELADSILVSPEEIKEYYEGNEEKFVREEDEVRASQIIVKTIDEAEMLRTKLVFRADFAGLAQEVSLDPETKFRGGDLGYFTKSMILPEIAEVVFKLGVGHLSKPIETEWGFHVIKVTDKKKKGSIRELWEVENLIANFLSGQERKEMVDRYIQNLEGKYKIEKYDWAIEDTTKETR
ncbi:MAG: peptidylprolyl isomerase [Candidatus Zixiibacteriota bacterium]